MFKKIKSKFGSLWKYDVRSVVNNKILETRTKKMEKYLAYSKQTKRLFEMNPHLIRDFLSLRQKVIKSGKNATVGNIVLENISRRVSGNTATRFYKLSIQGKNYFVKEIEQGKHGKYFDPLKDSPQAQINALEKAKSIIKKDKIFSENFEIITPHLGFSGDGKTFLVTNYINGSLVSSFGLENHPGELTRFKWASDGLIKKFNEANLGDFGTHNVLYNEVTKKFFIFDLRTM